MSDADALAPTLGHADEAAAFLSTLFSGDDTFVIKPIESWIDTADSRQHTRALYRSFAYRRISASSPAGWEPIPQPTIATSLLPILRTAAAERANLYVGVAPRFGGNGQYERAWAIRRVNALWCDLDHISIPEAAERCQQASKRGPVGSAGLPPLPPPSIAVASGNGVHLYWLLDAPYAIDDCPDPPALQTEFVEIPAAAAVASDAHARPPRKRREFYIDPATGEKTILSPATSPDLSPKALAIQDALHGLATALSADHTFDLSRILRLPGTYNRKDERNGRIPILARLIRCDPSARYPISSFLPYATLSPSAADRRRVATIVLPPRRVPTSSRDTDRLTTLINECAAAEISTRSEVDFHLCCEAVERGWDKGHVWSMAAAVGKFGERGEDYFNRTWEKAESHTRQKIFDETRKELQRRAAERGESGDTLDASESAESQPQHDGTQQDGTTPQDAIPDTSAAPPATSLRLPDSLHRERTALDRLQLDVLGIHNTIGVKLFSRFTRRVSSVPDVSRMTEEHLRIIACKPAFDWIATDAESANAGKFTLKDVQRALSAVASYAGHTDDRTKGIGCWRLPSGNRSSPDSVVIVGTNEAAIFSPGNSATSTPPAYRTHNHPRCGPLLLNFEQREDRKWIDLSHLGTLISQAASQSFVNSALDEADALFNLWKWRGEASPSAMVGLVLATFVQTVWEWRPQINITGPSKSGKSILFSTLADLFHGLSILTLDATAAGARDYIGDSASVFLHDEFDARTDKKHGRQMEIREMIRASGRGGGSLRSSATGKARKSDLSHIFWMGGIDFGSDDEADKNRIVALELASPKAEIIPPSMHDLRDLGQRLLAIAVRNAIQSSDVASALLRQWSEFARSDAASPQEKRIDSRVIQSYAVPAAILAVCKGYEPLAVLRQIVVGTLVDEEEIAKDHENLLAEILSAKIQDLPEHPNVGQCLSRVLETWNTRIGSGFDGGSSDGDGSSSNEQILASNGVGVGTYTDEDVTAIVRSFSDGSVESQEALQKIADGGCLLLAYKVISTHLFKGSKHFAGRSLEQLLRRVPFSRKSKRRVGKILSPVVMVPLMWVRQEFLGDGGGEFAGLKAAVKRKEG